MQKKPKQQQNKLKGQRFESDVQRTLNSGSLWFSKGDLQTQDYLIEVKYTDKKSFRITTKILKKIFNEAFEQNKLPALVIGIKDNEDENVVWELQVQINRKLK